MDGRGGCCIARYGATNGGGAYNNASKIDRIMLRFRPIAPKPSSGGSSSGGSSPESRDSYVKTGRGRRRYARQSSSSDKVGGVGNRKRCGRKTRPQPAAAAGSPRSVIKKDAAVSPGDHRAVVTLPLLPETPELISRSSEINDHAWRNDNIIAVPGSGYGGRSATAAFGAGEVCYFREQRPRQEEPPVLATWLNFAAVRQPIARRLQVEAWVTVECMMETWLGKYALGRTDEERRQCLREDDACPGFVSDRLGRVTWTNGAFRQTVIGDAPGIVDNVNIAVWLAMKDVHPSVPVTAPLLALHAGAFTCRVRMQYASREDNNIKGSMTVPCDVWRMDAGGFAWRLDVKAALSLGR